MDELLSFAFRTNIRMQLTLPLTRRPHGVERRCQWPNFLSDDDAIR